MVRSGSQCISVWVPLCVIAFNTTVTDSLIFGSLLVKSLKIKIDSVMINDQNDNEFFKQRKFANLSN